MKRPHLLVAISPHGFGHTVQVAAVIRALRRVEPALRLTLRTTVSPTFLAERIGGDFTLQRRADDFGMVQHDPLCLDQSASCHRYRTLHADWPGAVSRVAGEIAAVEPTLLLADIPYLTLAAAAEAGISSVALCCLNWAELHHHYCPDDGAIGETILAAYNSAECFLQSEPSMAMPGLVNGHPIGPVSEPGRNRRDRLLAHFGLSADSELVLVGMGGIGSLPAPHHWPHRPGRYYLLPGVAAGERPDILAIDDSGLSFQTLLASCDLLVTKPGYGAFTEAAASGVPVLYVRRSDGWPEQQTLIDWLTRVGRCAGIDAGAFRDGDFRPQMESLLAAGRYRPVAPTGVGEVVTQLLSRLR